MPLTYAFDLCLAQGTDAAAAIVIVDRFSAAYAAAALFSFVRMCLDGNGSIWQNFHVIYSGILDI